MRDIHSIGQAFKIVSERTAKDVPECLLYGKGGKKQESSPQIFLYFEKHQKGYLELAIPTTEKVKQIKNRILFERKQAREEMLKEIPCPQMTNSSISECVCEWCKSFKEEKLVEGGKK